MKAHKPEIVNHLQEEVGSTYQHLDTLNSKMTSEKWYETLVEDCHQAVIAVKACQIAVQFKGYYMIGKAINNYKEEFKKNGWYGDNVIQKVSNSVGVSHQYIRDAVKMSEMFSDFSEVPIHQVKSWNHFREKYLMSLEDKTASKKKEKCCPNCGHKL